MGSVAFALTLTLLAGSATAVGGALAVFGRATNPRFLSLALGFSAGVMLFVALVEILDKARVSLSDALGPGPGGWVALGSFLLGIVIIGVIDRLVPDEANPHEPMRHDAEGFRRAKLMRTGSVTALALALHNFPEGFATFIAALQEPSIAIPVTVAIALHNIPEGVAVAVPIHYATGSWRKAFVFAAASGLAEPVGAVIGYLLLAPFMSPTLLGIVFGAVAGIMVFVSVDELMPTAHEYDVHHIPVYGLVAGMIAMGASLLLLA